MAALARLGHQLHHGRDSSGMTPDNEFRRREDEPVRARPTWPSAGLPSSRQRGDPRAYLPPRLQSGAHLKLQVYIRQTG
jgi:hypothetical protein